MQPYSPPLTRQRAKALHISQQGAIASRRRGGVTGISSSTVLSVGDGDEQKGVRSRSRGRGRGLGGLGAGAVDDHLAASNGPKSVTTVGSVTSRCRKGRGRAGTAATTATGRVVGVARDGRDPAVAVSKDTGGLGGAVSISSNGSSISSSLAQSYGDPASPPPRGAVSPPPPGGPGVLPAAAVGASLLSSKNQPLEEVNPSVLNAKNSSSAGGNRSNGGNVCNDGAVSSGGSSSSISSRNNSILSSRTNSNTMGVAGDVVFHASPEVSPTIMPHSNDSGDGNGDGDADVTDSAVKTTTTMAAATMTTTTTPSSRSSGEENHGLLPDPPASTAAERAPSSDRAPSTVISCSSADCDVGGVVAPTSAAMGGTVMDSRDGGEVPREESLRPGVVARSSSVEGGERGGGAEEEGGEASRRNGKSVEAKGSTGVSPMQKRNRRELKLSEEETAMAGAPQGPVYQVAVLETREFEASPNPGEEMQAVLTAAGGAGDWADHYSALDSARRLCIFHKEVLMRDEGNLESVVGLIAAAVGNLRSSTVRNALLGVGDMFSFLEQDMSRIDVRPMVAATLQRLAGDKRFICNTAAQAMESAARKGPGVVVLHAILPGVEDRNAEISAKAAVYSEQCLAALGVGGAAATGMPEGVDTQRLLSAMGKALNGKVAEGRTAGKRALLRSRKAMGHASFESTVTDLLPKPEATHILSTLAACTNNGSTARGKASGLAGRAGAGRSGGRGGTTTSGAGRWGGGARTGPGRGGASGGRGAGVARPSIREQMMARKLQLEEEKRRAECDDNMVNGAVGGGAEGGTSDGGGAGGRGRGSSLVVS